MRKSFVLAVLVPASLLMTAAAQERPRDDVTVTPRGNTLALDINSGRAVFSAVRTFEERYGYIITYEDPSYVNSDDVMDATNSVRRHRRAAGPGVRAIMLPRPTELSLQIPVSSCISPRQMASLLTNVVESRAPGGGQFRVEQSGSLFRLVPTQIRDRSGNWSAADSPLDTRISFPAQLRTEEQLLDTIARDVAFAAHVRMSYVIDGGFVIGIPGRHHFQFDIGADDETAREVLTRMFEEQPQRRQSWALLNAVEESPITYELNIMDLPPAPSCHAVPRVTPPKPFMSGCMYCAPPSGN